MRNVMQEDELRALVRDAIERRLGACAAAALPPERQDISHARFPVTNGADEDGPCLIEPSVGCNRCGYCQSYGH
jgi:hypothetical protein